MTPVEETISNSRVAVAWADGALAEPESGMIDSLLWAFGASEDEEQEIREKQVVDGARERAKKLSERF